MIAVPKWNRPLKELLKGPELSAELELLAQKAYPYVVQWQDWPDLFLHEIAGLVVTVHQRLMLNAAHRMAAINVNVSSRGTAKSATICALYDMYLAAIASNRKLVMLSATGFRGGQMMLSDIESVMKGGWDSQRSPGYIEPCVRLRPQQRSPVHRAPNWWRIEFETNSHLSTYPTNDEDTIRGIRGHMLFVDEANTFDPNTLDRVVVPFLNVGGDFEHGGAYGLPNCIYYTSTIDYSWRPFMKTVRAAEKAIARDYDVWKANQEGDKERALRLSKEGLHEYTYVSFDYTDVLIPSVITTRDGRKLQVKHPNPKLQLEFAPKGIPFTEKDASGAFKLEGEPLWYYSTYPIKKNFLEQPLLNGTADDSMWLSEQRNVEDNATGDVYPYAVLDKVSCEREPMIPYDKCTDEWKSTYKDFKQGFSPGVLYRCTDPVVIAVDYAGGERDYCAFVVIRVGPLAEGVFNPFTQQGYTSWSNVIWCEQHRQMSHRQVMEKLWLFMDRYPNLAWHYDQSEQDTWKLCRAIGLDMKGGGSGVRDALVFLDQETVPAGYKRILDPLDQDSRIQAYLKNDPQTLPILDAIQPSDLLNDRCVEFTLAQMKSGNLWLPKWRDVSERSNERDTDAGYIGSRILKHQLQRIQQRPTKNYRQFFMPGSSETNEGKKDLFSAFLYATKQLRAHLIRFQTVGVAVTEPIAIKTAIGVRNHGARRAIGARR